MEKEEFLSRVKSNLDSELKTRKTIRFPSWKKSLLRLFGWTIIAIGAIFTLGFFILMESVYSQLGGLANMDFAAALESTDEVSELMAAIGIDWFPTFMKIYSIRFAIVLGMVTFTAALAFALFSFSKSLKD